MALNQLFQVVLSGEFGEQTTQNVFWYEQKIDFDESVIKASRVLAFDFYETVLPAIRNVLHVGWYARTIAVQNWFVESDFSETLLFSDNGTRTGEWLPLVNALSLRSNRPGYGFRRSFKRFSPITETDFSQGALSADYQTQVQNLCDALSSSLGGQSNNFFEPVIVSGVGAYGVYTGIKPITNWGTCPTPVGTQLTRKR